MLTFSLRTFLLSFGFLLIAKIPIWIAYSWLQDAQYSLDFDRKHWWRYVITGIACDTLVESLFVYPAWIFFPDALNNIIWLIAYEIFSVLLVVAVNYFFYRHKGKTELLKIIATVFLVIFLLGGITAISTAFETWFYPQINISGGLVGGTDMLFETLIRQLTPPVITLLLAKLLATVMKKLNYAQFVELLFQNRQQAIAVTLGLGVLVKSYRFLQIGFPFLADTNFFPIASLIILILFISSLFVTAIAQTNKEKLQSQTLLIEQQNNYVLSLEHLQQEMRYIKHDFENILTGIYLQASDGDLAGVQNYLQETLQYFDKKIGVELKEHTQLQNIKIMPLKSLILTKSQEIKSHGIEARIEVVYPIEQISMETNDLLRCLGILIDNAIEEVVANGLENVSIVLFNDGKTVSIHIENPVIEAPVLHQIYKAGFSTKGENRGLGLSSYHKIVNRYQNIYINTSCKDGRFRQTLEINNL